MCCDHTIRSMPLHVLLPIGGVRSPATLVSTPGFASLTRRPRGQSLVQDGWLLFAPLERVSLSCCARLPGQYTTRLRTRVTVNLLWIAAWRLGVAGSGRGPPGAGPRQRQFQ